MTDAGSTAGQAQQMLSSIGDFLDDDGPFHEWLEKIMRPWELLGGDAWLDKLIEVSDEGLASANTLYADLGGASDAAKKLSAILPGLHALDLFANTAGIVGGLYTMIDPPEYDKGAMRWVSRTAGAAAVIGDGIGLGVGFGAIAPAAAIAGLSIPLVGEVLGVGAGIFMAADWIYHHTHQIEHGYETARNAVERYAHAIAGDTARLFAADCDRHEDGQPAASASGNAVDVLVRMAAERGAIPLPALTEAELCALGAAKNSLVTERAAQWWGSFGDDEREGLVVRALALLATRRLLSPASGEVPAVPVPALGVILAARANPEPLVVCHVVKDIDAARDGDFSRADGREVAHDDTMAPRFFGLAGQDGRTRAVVCEMPAGAETIAAMPTATSAAMADSAAPVTAGSGDGETVPDGSDQKRPDGRLGFGRKLHYALMTPETAGRVMSAWARGVRGHRFSLSHHHAEEQPVATVFHRNAKGLLCREVIDPASGTFPLPLG